MSPSINSGVRPAAVNQKDAAIYLSVNPRWLDDAPIPRVDMRKPGATRPVWRWLVVDLDDFLDGRRVAPGRPSVQK